MFFFFFFFIALYLGLVVGEKHVYRKNGLSITFMFIFSKCYLVIFVILFAYLFFIVLLGFLIYYVLLE